MQMGFLARKRLIFRPLIGGVICAISPTERLSAAAREADRAKKRVGGRGRIMAVMVYACKYRAFSQ